MKAAHEYKGGAKQRTVQFYKFFSYFHELIYITYESNL